MTIWVTDTGQELELPDNFNPEGLKAMGWKKKRGPKKQVAETPELELGASDD